MKIAEFVAELTLKGGKDAVNTMRGLLNSTVATKAAILGAATALYKMSEAARQSAMFMDMYQLNTGLSTTQLQKLSYQASQAGVSMQELGGAIQRLQQMNANARLGYGWDPIFTRLGLTPGQDPVTQLNQMGAALRRMQATNPAEAKALAARAGISDSMYYAMLRGTTEQMNKQLILTDKEQKALVKLNQQWNKFWFYLKQVTIKIQALGANFQNSVVRVLVRAVQGFYELFSRIWKVVEASDSLKNAVIAIGLAFTAFLAPELLLLSALALVLEDIFTYFEGGDSVTGRLVEWCNQSEEFKGLWEAISTVFKVFVEIIKMAFTGWKELIAVLNDSGFITAVLESITTAIHSFLDAILLLFKIPFVRKALERAGFGNINELADAQLARDEDFMANAAEAIARPAQMVAQGVSDMVQNNNTNVYIQSTGDARRDAENAMDARRAIQQANAQQPNLANGGKNGGYRYSHQH